MKSRPVVLTIGTFDGVHRGHQALLNRASSRARHLGGELLAVAFDEPPRQYFVPTPGPFLLTTPEEKMALLKTYGADRVDSVRFGPSWIRTSAREFLQRFVRKRWNAQEIVVGFNFRFGKNREGDIDFIRQTDPWLRADRVGPLLAGREVISSGRIRSLVLEGHIKEAERLLGHPYAVTAQVIRGQRLGRRLGFPTANLDVPDEKILPRGVFGARVRLALGVDRKAICNVGVRPTVSGLSRRTMEVHLLDFSGELVGRNLTVEFVGKIREERAFPSLASLSRQIHKDESLVRGWKPEVWR